jgi:CRP/FNR family transcriptional regulator, cyclic AMP receptor protein
VATTSTAARRPHPEVRALLRSRLLALPWADVEALVHQDWTVSRWLVRVLLEGQRAAQLHTGRLVSHGVPGRLEAVLAELAEEHGRGTRDGIRVALPLTQDMLASLVGASRETVTRALADLERRGRISRAGRSYILPLSSPGARR